MRNPTESEIAKIKITLERLEDLENERQLLEAELRNQIHKLRRECGAPGNAQLDANTFCKWVRRQKTQAGMLEIPLINKKRASKMDIVAIGEIAKCIEQFGALPLLIYVIMKQRIIWQHVSNHLPTEIKELKKIVGGLNEKLEKK